MQKAPDTEGSPASPRKTSQSSKLGEPWRGIKYTAQVNKQAVLERLGRVQPTQVTDEYEVIGKLYEGVKAKKALVKDMTTSLDIIVSGSAKISKGSKKLAAVCGVNNTQGDALPIPLRNLVIEYGEFRTLDFTGRDVFNSSLAEECAALTERAARYFE
ncbi:hypothetical protein CYMTET_28454, partial [Cymbomonas tetramitiformis]